jgi:hypothetical protein
MDTRVPGRDSLGPGHRYCVPLLATVLRRKETTNFAASCHLVCKDYSFGEGFDEEIKIGRIYLDLVEVGFRDASYGTGIGQRPQKTRRHRLETQYRDEINEAISIKATRRHGAGDNGTE